MLTRIHVGVWHSFKPPLVVVEQCAQLDVHLVCARNAHDDAACELGRAVYLVLRNDVVCGGLVADGYSYLVRAILCARMAQ